jgi:hypothetical protein
MTQLEFASRIIMLGSRYNGSVISWGRSVKRNQEVGGLEPSLHVMWLAADVAFDTVAESTQAAQMATRVGLFWKRNGDKTLHIQALKPPRNTP